MAEQLRDARLWVMVIAILLNAAAWLFGVGGKVATMEYRMASAETKIAKIESVLDKLASQQSETARNLEVLTALVKRYMEERR